MATTTVQSQEEKLISEIRSLGKDFFTMNYNPFNFVADAIEHQKRQPDSTMARQFVMNFVCDIKGYTDHPPKNRDNIYALAKAFNSGSRMISRARDEVLFPTGTDRSTFSDLVQFLDLSSAYLFLRTDLPEQSKMTFDTTNRLIKSKIDEKYLNISRDMSNPVSLRQS